MPHKLLLADDSITIQRVIELTFADEDVHVRAVGDGKSAIDSIQSERPDIVLADVGMPERDGYEVAEFIKGNPQLASIPVLLLTGAFEPIDESRARAVGCDGVLVKPFEPQMVINRVKDLLAGRRSAGLWGNKAAPSSSPEGTPAAPPKDANPQPAVPAAATATSASLEDYFDRLDAAFASVEAATEGHSVVPVATRSPDVVPAAHAASGSASGLAKHDLEGWDPDLTGDPIKPKAPQPPSLVPAVSPPKAAAAPAQPEPAPPAVASPAVAPIPFKSAAQAPPDVPTAAPEAAAPPSPARPAGIPFAAPAPVPPPVELPPAAAASAAAPAIERQEPTPSPVAPLSTMVAAPGSTPSVAAGQTSMPSLADAFAALLSAEQGRSISPSKVGAPSVPDSTVDDIVNRVIARMTDQSVRETVIEIAERLVREEIERIKLGQ